MIELKTRLMVFLVMWLFLSSGGHGSGLPSVDLVRLLDEDWSVIERTAATIEASSRNVLTSSRPVAGITLEQIVRAIHSGPHVDVVPPQLPTRETMPPQPSSSEQRMGETNSASESLREGVLVPTSLPPIDVTSRTTELQSVSTAVRDLYNSRLPERKVLPLIVQNMPARTYKTYFEELLSPRHKPSFRWTHSDGTYLFSKPKKNKHVYEWLFGVSEVGSEEFYATWKLFEYGQAKIWRLLGVIEMPSHQTTRKILNKHMVEIPGSDLRPDWFLDDGAHLDPSQIATRFGRKDDIHTPSR